MNLTLPEASIIFGLALLTTLYGGGLWKFAIDVGYIYIFPFVCIYLLARLLFALVRFFFRHFAGESNNVEVSVRPQVVEVKATAPTEPEEQPRAEAKTEIWWKNAVIAVFLPFRRFPLLWCLLLLLSSRTLLVWVALLSILFHLAKSLITMVSLTLASMTWLGKLEDYAKTRIEELLGRFAVLPKDAELTSEMKKSAGLLVGIRLGVQLLNTRRQIWMCAVALSVGVLAVLYANLALLFSFAEDAR